MRKLTFWLSLAFIFVLPWENVLMFGGGETLSRLIGVVVAGVWIITVLITNRIRIPLPFHIAVLVFILWNAISLFWSADQDRTYERIQTYSQLAILVFMLWDIYTTPHMLLLGVQAYVLGAYITAGSTLYSYLNTTQYYYNRYSANGFNPNDAGLILALGIPLAWHLALYTGETKIRLPIRILNFAYLPAAIFAIFLTGSRGTLAAAAVSFFFIFATFTQMRPKVQIVLIISVVVTTYIVLGQIPTTSVERIAAKGVALNGRENVWSEAFELVASHPILGVGSGAVKKVIEKQQSAHNFALAISAELGIIGLGFFAIILLLVFLHGWRQDRHNRYLWLTILAIWILGASVHNWEQRKQTWFFFSLIVISGSCAVSAQTARSDKDTFLISSRESEMEFVPNVYYKTNATSQ